MFKKQLADLKTSAPLKNSDRRKLRQRVLQDYSQETTEVGDILVPDGLQSVKFTTSGGEPGLAYLSAEGEPLWFTLGKGNNDLIPTVYTLWKRPRLLPHLSTPSAVIPVLQNGADLMAAGVVEMLGTPNEGQLVSITRYTQGALGPPLAVGRMAMPGTKVREDDAKGKAVKVLHVFKDKLWEMGGKGEPPEPEVLPPLQETPEQQTDERGDYGPKGDVGDEQREEKMGFGDTAENVKSAATPPPPSEVGEPEILEEDAAPPPLDPQEVSKILRTSIIQAIRTTLSSLPQSNFPIPSTTFYTRYILPFRPAHLASISSPSPTTPIDIKHSSHKNLTSFLRTADKEGLLRLKEQRGGGGGDVLVMSVNKELEDVKIHQVYRTIGEIEAKKERKEGREAKSATKPKEIGITELWKPHQQSIRLFEECGKDSTALYTHQQLKETLNAYITSKSLVNRNQQQFINIDELLGNVLATKRNEVPEFLKREDLLKGLIEKMQPWHKIEVEGKDPVVKKGKLNPILLQTKLRQGRKACTLITNFEPYPDLSADSLAEELRRVCASSTSVNPLPGKSSGGLMEVMVQGKQIGVVRDVLIRRGIPKAWIEESDLIGGGGKKK